MPEGVNMLALTDASSILAAGALTSAWHWFLVFVGFSLVIFVHELGHFIAAKACGVRVDKFAIGFGREVFGWTRGETRYALNLLPLGGYVKMLGQEDFAVDKSGEIQVKDDPRAFTHKSIGQRMIIVSSGVVMNLIFAAVVFAIVFMIGMEAMPARVGEIMPGMPADRAGLRSGDEILKINDTDIADYPDMQMAVTLAAPDEPLRITYQRTSPAGQAAVDTVTLYPEATGDQGMLKIGVVPPKTNEVMYAEAPAGTDPARALKARDRIVAVNDLPTPSFWQVQDALANLRGDYAKLSVQRPGIKEPLEIPWRAKQDFLQTRQGPEESGHLLGLIPRQRVGQVTEGGRADLAGIKAEDVIVRWGGQVAPTAGEILRSRRENGERDIRVTIYRPGEGPGKAERQLVVRPKVTGLLKKSTPTVGLAFGTTENDHLVVADIVTQVTEDIPTPAAKLKELMPRGSLITRVDDQPVKTWDELTRYFIAHGGQDVRLSWSYEGQPEQSEVIHVPATIGTVFQLPASHRILSINPVGGEPITRKEVNVNGRTFSYTADNWAGACEILRDHLGKQVTVTWADNLDSSVKTSDPFIVTPEMLDTWVQRVEYRIDDFLTWFERITLRETNPVKASLIGLRKTWYFIEQVYITMQRMIIDRSLDVDQVSGPVGIFKMGSEVAAAGFPVLMYFLALISANLAVINFLPLPIVDGGLFIFLLIEKIKGSPVNMKVQVATQLIGLVLIIGIFIFVTIQDIQKLTG